MDALLHVFPTVSMSFIVLIVACIVALNADRLGDFGGPVIASVILTNMLGLLAGYMVAIMVFHDVRVARTVAIEVGMQNSGLGGALATQFFAGPAALPSAFFSVWHNITGPALAAHWARRPAPIHDGAATLPPDTTPR